MLSPRFVDRGMIFENVTHRTDEQAKASAGSLGFFVPPDGVVPGGHALMAHAILSPQGLVTPFVFTALGFSRSLGIAKIARAARHSRALLDELRTAPPCRPGGPLPLCIASPGDPGFLSHGDFPLWIQSQKSSTSGHFRQALGGVVRETRQTTADGGGRPHRRPSDRLLGQSIPPNWRRCFRPPKAPLEPAISFRHVSNLRRFGPLR